MPKFLWASISLLLLNACSVGMAMSGKEDPNLGMVRVGATRGEVELTLGPPIKTMSLDGAKRIDTYKYEIGNAPSGGRAFGHALMDLATFGIWEIIGTPIEAVQGDTYELNLIYDKEDRVEKINSATKVEAYPPTTASQECNPTNESCV